jgi:membrane fusion protein, multidrug efflux system
LFTFAMENTTPESSTKHETPLLPAPAHPMKELPPPAGTKPRKRRLWPLFLILVIGAAGFYWWWSHRTPSEPAPGTAAGKKGGGRGGRAGGGTPPVVATKARKGDIGVYYEGLGTVTPINTVTVKTRVDGELMSVNFKEGDLVQQGQSLADIDPRPYQAQLTQFEGQLARDQASLENAKLDLKRYEILIAQNAVAGQQLDTQRSMVKQFEGAVKIDEGQIQGVKLNIAYSHITAPVTGRIGLRLVDPGNIVHASDQNGMLVITQIQPISVIFTLGEDQLQEVVRRLRGGQRLRVDAWDKEMRTKITQGTLATVDNQIDQTTGTVRLRATFDNANNALFPNQFVNCRLLVETKHGVVLLTSAAIQRNSNMIYVYSVDGESKVSIKQITIGVSAGDDTEITSGLNPGDEVVMTGVDKLQDGQKVVVHMEGEAGQPGQPGGRRGNRGAGKSTDSGPGVSSPGGDAPTGNNPGGRGKRQGK